MYSANAQFPHSAIVIRFFGRFVAHMRRAFSSISKIHQFQFSQEI